MTDRTVEVVVQSIGSGGGLMAEAVIDTIGRRRSSTRRVPVRRERDANRRNAVVGG